MKFIKVKIQKGQKNSLEKKTNSGNFSRHLFYQRHRVEEEANKR